MRKPSRQLAFMSSSSTLESGRCGDVVAGWWLVAGWLERFKSLAIGRLVEVSRRTQRSYSKAAARAIAKRNNFSKTMSLASSATHAFRSHHDSVPFFRCCPLRHCLRRSPTSPSLSSLLYIVVSFIIYRLCRKCGKRYQFNHEVAYVDGDGAFYEENNDFNCAIRSRFPT